MHKPFLYNPGFHFLCYISVGFLQWKFCGIYVSWPWQKGRKKKKSTKHFIQQLVSNRSHLHHWKNMTVLMEYPGKGSILHIPPPHWAGIRAARTSLLRFCPVSSSFCSGIGNLYSWAPLISSTHEWDRCRCPDVESQFHFSKFCSFLLLGFVPVLAEAKAAFSDSCFCEVSSLFLTNVLVPPHGRALDRGC